MTVVWNGSMKDTYLCVPPVSPPPFEIPLAVGVHAAIYRHLPSSEREAITVQGLIARTGYHDASVRKALFQLNRSGAIATARTQPTGRMGRPISVYWRKAAA